MGRPIEMEGVHTRTQIAQVRQKIASEDAAYKAAYEQFLERANMMLDRKPSAVEEYYIPWYYVQAKEHVENSKALTGDAYAAYACALAYCLSDDEKYAEKARKLLNSWAKINKSLKPIEDTPLVTAYGGVGLIHAAELLEGYAGWTSSEQAAFKNWVTGNYQPAIDSIKGNLNNWGGWGTMAAISTYCYLNDPDGVNGEIDRMKAIIDNQICHEGYLPEEAKRERNSMWYHYFALAPMTATAQIARNATGVDLFAYTSPKGVSLKKALDYFAVYVKEPSAWPHYTGEGLSKPILANGADPRDYSNWPTSMYVAMSAVYSDSDYDFMVDSYAPVLGGWNKERGAHHIAWCFPSLMKP